MALLGLVDLCILHYLDNIPNIWGLKHRWKIYVFINFLKRAQKSTNIILLKPQLLLLWYILCVVRNVREILNTYSDKTITCNIKCDQMKVLFYIYHNHIIFSMSNCSFMCLHGDNIIRVGPSIVGGLTKL